MAVQFKIKVTKEILQLSRQCGTHSEIENFGENCAIALSLKDIFPDVFVTGGYVYPYGIDASDECDKLKIWLPDSANDFISRFDSAAPNDRGEFSELEFEISIPDNYLKA